MVLLRERFLTLEVPMKLKILVVATMYLACAGTASAGWPTSLLGAQLRQASPWAYQAYLGSVRRIPPQVKNQMPMFGAYPRMGAYSPWQQELGYWRSIPPQVKNSMHQRGYPVAPPRAYLPPQAFIHPQAYVPAQAYVPTVRQPLIQATIVIGPGVTAPPLNSIMPYAGR
jgi:hypothetical protein